VVAVLAVLVAFLVQLRRKREYLSGNDSVFVSCDENNLIVVHAIGTTKTPVALEVFCDRVASHFACHRRFRQRVVKRHWKWHYLQEVKPFALDNHIEVVDELPEVLGADDSPAGLHSRLQALVSTIVQTPLNMERPPWQFYFLPQYGSGSACIFRVHHSLADGITLMRVAMRAFEADTLRPRGQRIELISPGLNQSPSPDTQQRSATPQPAANSSQTNRATGRQFAAVTGFKALVKFKKPRTRAPRTLFGKVSAVLKQVVKVMLLPSDPVSRFKPATPIRPSVPANARWLSQPLSLAELKQLSYATGTSVNDVLFTIVASALRRFCLQENLDPSTLSDVRSLMWVSLQGTATHSDEPITFGNRIGAIYMRLPMGEGDDLRRLLMVRDYTSSLQVSPEPMVTNALMGLIGLAPWAFIQYIWKFLAFKATSSMSNVPGPQEPVHFAGAEISDLVFFVPCQGTIASFITILSYAGGVQMGCLFDSRVVEEPQRVLDLFVEEYQRLKEHVDKLQKEGTLQQALGLQDKDKA